LIEMGVRIFSVDQDFSAMRRYYVQALSRLRAATEAPAK
jgi:hypothetical protein